MTIYKETQEIDYGLVRLFNDALRRGEAVTYWEGKKVKDDEVLETYTFDFGGGIAVDVKLCNGNGPWAEAVLFKDGIEVLVSEPTDQWLYEWEFEMKDGDTYVVGFKVTISRSEAEDMILNSMEGWDRATLYNFAHDAMEGYLEGNTNEDLKENYFRVMVDEDFDGRII